MAIQLAGCGAVPTLVSVESPLPGRAVAAERVDQRAEVTAGFRVESSTVMIPEKFEGFRVT